MALVLLDRVQQTGTANTTVSFTLSGSVTGYQSFAGIGNGNTTYYGATDTSGNWEAGIGTYSTTGPTLTRTTILSSSNSGSAVTFSGAVTVFVTYPSERSVNLDGSSNVSALGTISSGVWNGSTIPVAYGGTGVTSSSGANSVMLRDANQNVSINRLNQSSTTTTAAGTTTTLTAASTFSQVLSGTGGQTFKLPDATTLTNTTTFEFNNNATGTLTIVDNASGAVGTVASGGAAAIALLSNGTIAGTWDVHAYIPENVQWGTNSLALGSTVISGGTWQGGTIASGYGGTGLTTFTAANNALYSTSASALAAGTLPVAAGGTGKTAATAALANLQGYTTTANVSFATTAASGDGTTATLTFATQASAPFAVGSTIFVAGVTPSGYNTTTGALVTACTLSTVSYLNATSGAQTVAGTVTAAPVLTNTSSYYQLFTGVTIGAVILPVASTLQLGWSYKVYNASTAVTTVYSSGGNSILALNANSGGTFICIDTALTTAAAWRLSLSDFGTQSGSGSVVLSNSPTITGTLGFTGTSTSGANFASGQTTGSTNIVTIQTTGITTVGGTATTGALILGRSTGSQYIDIANGATTASTTASGTASSITTTVLTVGGTVTGTFVVGMQLTGTNVLPNTYITTLGTGTGGAGTYNISQTQTVASTTITGTTQKTISIGTGGLAGSITNITVGSTAGTSTTNLQGNLQVNGAAGTSGQVLQSNGSGSAPTWVAPGGSTVLNTTEFTATSGQTSFTVTYTPALLEGVYRNGIKLGTADYTSTSGTAIVLATGAITGDLIQVVAFTSLATTTAVNSFSAGTTGFTPSTATAGAVTLAGTLNVANGGTGQTSFTAGQIHYGSFSTSSNLFWDSTNSYLGLGTNSPSYRLQLGTNTSTSTATPETLSLGGTYSSTAGANGKLRIYNDGTGNYMGFGVSANQLDYITTSSFFSHVFYTNSSERMRITSSGGIAFGGSTNYGTTGQVLTSNGNAAPTWSAAPGATITGTTTAGTYYVVGTTSTSGSLTTASISNTNAVSYNANTGALTAVSMVSSSDERLKSNIQTITNAVQTVENLRGVSYLRNDRPEIGVVAQEVEKVLPMLVHEDPEGYKSVAYGNMVGLLIEAVKELSAEVKALKAELNK